MSDIPRPLSPATEQALTYFPPNLVEDYRNLFATPEAKGHIHMMKQTAAMLHQAQESAAAAVAAASSSSNATPPDPFGSSGSAQARLELKKTLLKKIKPIRDYQGYIQYDAARRFLRDCQRFFDETARFAGASLDDSDKVMHARGALVKKADDVWVAHQRQCELAFEQPIDTWAAFERWILQSFGEHLGKTKKWERFSQMKQGDQQQFNEYATNKCSAAADCEDVQIHEDVLIQHLITDAKMYLRQRWEEERDPPTTLSGVIERFLAYERGSTRSKYIARASQQNPHDPMDLSAMNDTSDRPRNQRPKKSVTCFGCGKKGHFRRDCRNLKPSEKSEN
jgi:hypothetical protein